MVKLKELIKDPIAGEEYFLKGNSSCSGCGGELSIRWILKALGKRTIVVTPASCFNVTIGLYPKAAPAIPYLNMAFAAGAAACSGIAAGLAARKKRDPSMEDITVLCYGGDGGTIDIGIQGLSGAAERGSNIIYICYDNEAYMNTGTQRSGGTPFGAWTTTTPTGKRQHKKNVPMIMAAHGIPYVATASSAYPLDLYQKVKKAKDIKGTKYIHVLAPCAPGWRFPTELTIEVGRKAVQTGMWVLYEIENGKMSLSGPSKKFLEKEKRLPIEEYIKLQGRYRNISPEDIQTLQNWIDQQWESLQYRLQYCSEV
ncbi:MAG: 3-methyl-2-oxobutanoate dehydrogenase subunit beta [Candidatus Helarchaeota archaeon]|nr:3-methyl-2-oxobutanoate dehydrogenase subunit beta [Candidatus Helarchaeota archaeon]